MIWIYTSRIVAFMTNAKALGNRSAIQLPRNHMSSAGSSFPYRKVPVRIFPVPAFAPVHTQQSLVFLTYFKNRSSIVIALHSNHALEFPGETRSFRTRHKPALQSHWRRQNPFPRPSSLLLSAPARRPQSFRTQCICSKPCITHKSSQSAAVPALQPHRKCSPRTISSAQISAPNRCHKDRSSLVYEPASGIWGT